ncbi:MAG: hypothetical protein ABIB71_05525, partial [Candidatus Woesearchaeota archaeon]
VMDAIVDGKTVKGVEINYVHPKEQTEIEEHDLQFHRKRLEQLNNFIRACAKHWEQRLKTKLPVTL